MSDLPVIPGYRVEGEIASGGMATVYLGIQEKLNRRVAIKVLDPLLLKDPNFARRFLKEAGRPLTCRTPTSFTSSMWGSPASTTTSSWSIWRAGA